jgi:CMP-N,N'-diacetyllegionaminic acid synthase
LKNIAIIAARGGSKGLPGKNLKPLLGTQLVKWTVRQAISEGIFDEVLISSDSPEISIAAEQAGAKYLFDRPSYLASDTATSVDAILHALEFLEPENYEYVTYLECTSPIRVKGDISQTVDALVKNAAEFDASVAVCKVKTHPAIMLKKELNSFNPLGVVPKNMIRRQELGDVFHPFGGIYVIKVSALKEFRTFYPERLTGFELQDFQAFEIDDPVDFICVEAVINEYSHEVIIP